MGLLKAKNSIPICHWYFNGIGHDNPYDPMAEKLAKSAGPVSEPSLVLGLTQN